MFSTKVYRNGIHTKTIEHKEENYVKENFEELILSENVAFSYGGDTIEVYPEGVRSMTHSEKEIRYILMSNFESNGFDGYRGDPYEIIKLLQTTDLGCWIKSAYYDWSECENLSS